MKKPFSCSIGIIFVLLYTMLDCYYDICRHCGRVIPFDERKCPYCSKIFIEDDSEHKEVVSSMEILKKRYASGEITKKEFEDMKKDLEG